MEISLTDRSHFLHAHLDQFKRTRVAEYAAVPLDRKEFTIPIEAMDDPYSSKLFNYDIFPGNILQALPQWKVEQRSMRIGDTIAQQIQMPPLKFPSIKIIMGVRITELIKEQERIGFSYATLKGHVEVGVSTFTFEHSGDAWIFKVDVRSAPGNLLTRLVGPVFTMPYRNWSIRQALKHVKAVSYER